MVHYYLSNACDLRQANFQPLINVGHHEITPAFYPAL